MIYEYEINTDGNFDVINITDLVLDAIKKSKKSSGVINIFAQGSTCGITTIEYEPGLITDLKTIFKKIVPTEGNYKHNLHDDNAHSHLLSALYKTSITIPFKDSKPLLGTWQQVAFIDFDTHPRKRKIFITLI